MTTEPPSILIDDTLMSAMAHIIANTPVGPGETLADVLADAFQNDIDCPHKDLDGRDDRGLSPWALANANAVLKLIASRAVATIILAQERPMEGL